MKLKFEYDLKYGFDSSVCFTGVSTYFTEEFTHHPSGINGVIMWSTINIASIFCKDLTEAALIATIDFKSRHAKVMGKVYETSI